MKRCAVFAIVIFLPVFLLTACDSRKLHKEPISGFRGDWVVHGNGFYDGVQIRIQAEKGKQLKGRIIQLNDNKFVRFFCDWGSVLITGISRVSNTGFLVSENKVGKELFGAYGLETSSDLYAEFIDPNTIGLSPNRNHKGAYPTRLERIGTN